MSPIDILFHDIGIGVMIFHRETEQVIWMAGISPVSFIRFLSTVNRMDIPFVSEIIHWFALAFGVIGSALVIYGGIRAVIELLRSGFKRQSSSRSGIKREFTASIVFGLEFFIAGDILTTVLNPTLEDLTLLGAVVLIRVILGYFLEKEAKEFDSG